DHLAAGDRRRLDQPDGGGDTVKLWVLFSAIVSAAIGFIATSAYTASNTVPATHVGTYTHTIGAAELEPSACTGTVTRIITQTGGSKSYNTTGNLILGSNSQETVTIGTSGYSCFIGGGPTAGNNDKFTGKAAGDGDQCIVATSDAGGNIHQCTIV